MANGKEKDREQKRASKQGQNPNYSPLERITFEERQLTANEDRRTEEQDADKINR